MVKIELPADKAEALLEGLLDLGRYYDFLKPRGRDGAKTIIDDIAEELSVLLEKSK